MTLKKTAFVVGMLISWLLLMLFSHDYWADKTNTKNLIQRTHIEQGSHDFVVENFALDDIVSSFRGDWQPAGAGVEAIQPDPEVSIDLKGFLIVPEIHSALSVFVTAKTAAPPRAKFNLEFSNQKNQLFYQSEDLPLERINRKIELNSLNWRISSPVLEQKHTDFISWEDIGVFDALVVRFYDTQGISLAAVEIRQDAPQSIDSTLLETCGLGKVACWLNNHKQNLELTSHYEQGVSLMDYEVLIEYSPYIWLLLSLLLCLACLCLISVSGSVFVLVLGLYAVIGLLHQNWLLANAVWLFWLLVPMFAGLLWWKRQSWLGFRFNAIPVWLGSLVLGLTGVLFMPVDWGFLRSLPAYFVWAVLQQMLLGPVVADLCKKHSKATDGQVAVLVGVMFSIIHAPNHSLMIATLLAGFVWALSWLKYRNLYANAFSHAILALVFYQIMPAAWLGSARIGVFF